MSANKSNVTEKYLLGEGRDRGKSKSFKDTGMCEKRKATAKIQESPESNLEDVGFLS